VAKTHCAVNHHFGARQRVPHISMRRMQLMLPIPSDIELPLPSRLEQYCSFLAVYLMVLGWASLLLPRSWFVTLLRIAFPFLPKSLEQFLEDDHD
jgi:hypothetical protein